MTMDYTEPEGPITVIGVYTGGDTTWDVVAQRDGLEEPDGAIWCETKAEALKIARQLFNETPTARELVVENKREFRVETIRTRKGI
jgi:hypothetical protein